MTSLVIALLLAAAAFTSQETKKVPSDSIEIEARGCLKGRVFTATGQDETEGTRRGPDVTGKHFRINGPREVTDLAKKYNGQLVEVVGIVRKTALGNEGIGMKIGGNARVVIGAGGGGDPNRMNPNAVGPGIAGMDVTAIRYLADRCPIQ